MGDPFNYVRARSDSAAMILSCPSCSTRYSVAETTLGEAGRKVRCAACGHTWHVSPEAKTEPAALEPDPLVESEPLRPVPKDSARVYRDKVEARRRRRWRMVGGGAWAVVAAALIACLAVAWIFKLDIVRAWPQSASAYAAVGANANIYGMEFGDVAAQRVTVDGQPVLEIQSRLKNVDREPRPAPLVRFALQDEAGEEIFAWTVEPEAETLASGEQVAVVTQLIDPPAQPLNVALTLTDEAIAQDEDDAPEPAGEDSAEAGDKAPAQPAAEESAETDIADAREPG